ncbi:sigma-70 family RNA polymerase sigma factor [Nostoc punctiforme FACHB-252]|uniref:Sigma-70 family RNA polymerase sigma factor n=1 Tax=Nostoc punctiforme FACHB-252 TaxID=1357509 RepID=A0ABR8H2Y6_NOSPU|nr:sigma-70 family RNA polymerase sigma factor [Nostoc punctiforme]MBD2610068.1 sigma-70 family RNA polymerase sigma factor [Nostoc punctiforme FACHB-252]
MLNFVNLDGISTLPKRENNTDKFSTYLMLNHQNGRLTLQWKYQPYLKRNIELYVQRNEKVYSLSRQQDKGNGLAHFWHTVALKESQKLAEWEPVNKQQLALEHLASYFEERCYWAVKNICKYQNQENWEEYLCFARVIIYDPLKLAEILSKYNSQQSNIDTYVTTALENSIKDEMQVKKFSRWRMLCKKSDKELREALQVSGLSEPNISQIIFAKKYFKQVYLFNKVQNPARKNGQKWPDPDKEDFEQAAQCYNAEKVLSSAPHEVSAATNITAKQMQSWMENSIAALQNYPKSIVPQWSLDALQTTGYEAKSDIQEETLELEWQDSAEEVGESQQFLNKKTSLSLREQLEAMKPESQKLLLLYYGFGLNQQQLAARLEINQSTISRYLKKSTITLLETLAGISQSQEWVNVYVTNWLEKDYTNPLHSDLIQAALVSAIKKLSSEEKEIFQLCYGQKFSETKIANQLGIEQSKVKEKLSQIKYKVQVNLLEQINVWVKEYVEKWLYKHYKSLIKSILKTRNNSGQKLEREEIINIVIDAYFSKFQQI